MFGIPETTDFDLNFRVLGIPVRVHPFFWGIMALLGWSDGNYQSMLVFVGCAFVSILAHELGHGLTSKSFGSRPSIVLYGMGGLCYSDIEHQSPWKRLAVLFAGPGAGLLIFAVINFGLLETGLIRWEQLRDNPIALEVLTSMLWINLVWSIVNLFPIWPLDGGQITGVVLGMASRRNGMRWAHVASLLVAGGLAAFLFSRNQQINAMFCAYLGLINFQRLQALHQHSRYGGFGGDEDGDWWRK
ncbi:site-2 protease family protein [Isosphaeraceae bacterium EP7]